MTALLAAKLGETPKQSTSPFAAVLGGGAAEKEGRPVEYHCAAEVARYCDVALDEAVKAREEGLRRALGATAAEAVGATRISAAAADGAAFLVELRAAGLLRDEGGSAVAAEAAAGASPAADPVLRVMPGGVIVNVSSGYGEIAGVGQWMAMRYSEHGMAEELIRVFAHHFRFPGELLWCEARCFAGGCNTSTAALLLQRFLLSMRLLCCASRAPTQRQACADARPLHVPLSHRPSTTQARLGTNRYAPKPDGADRPVVVNGLVEVSAALAPMRFEKIFATRPAFVAVHT